MKRESGGFIRGTLVVVLAYYVCELVGADPRPWAIGLGAVGSEGVYVWLDRRKSQ